MLSDEEKEGFEHGFITAELIGKYAPEEYSANWESVNPPVTYLMSIFASFPIEIFPQEPEVPLPIPAPL